jgi:hypothetical protein
MLSKMLYHVLTLSRHILARICFFELMRVLVMSVKGVRERREIDTFHLGLHESARMQPVKMEAL